MDHFLARQQLREALATLAGRMQTKIPALNGRVEKACKLVLGGDVELHDDGTALVNSLTHPTLTYQIAPGLCECKDYTHAPEHLCCHRLAAGFLRKLQEQLPPPPPAAPVAAQVALPEAPASVNVRVTIQGREVQLTLRGQSEDDVLARLEKVLQRYAAAPSDVPQCPIHHVPMKINHGKDGRTWTSHKTPDGWCKGR